MEFHGIIVEESIKTDAKSKLNIIGKKKDSSLTKIAFPKNKLSEMEKIIQDGLKSGKFYAHLYDGNRLIVIFKEKTFHILVDKETWKPAIEYGIKIGIPRRQLDFFPCKFKDETY